MFLCGHGASACHKDALVPHRREDHGKNIQELTGLQALGEGSEDHRRARPLKHTWPDLQEKSRAKAHPDQPVLMSPFVDFTPLLMWKILK